MRFRIAFFCYLIVSLGYLALGAVYLFRQKLMPYHLMILDGASLVPQVELLLLSFLRGAGAATLASSISSLIILLIPFRRHEKWANYSLFAIGLSGSIPLLIIMYLVKARYDVQIPTWGPIGAITLLISGFIFASLSLNKDSRPNIK